MVWGFDLRVFLVLDIACLQGRNERCGLRFLTLKMQFPDSGPGGLWHVLSQAFQILVCIAVFQRQAFAF